jgi:hypothetical protein
MSVIGWPTCAGARGGSLTASVNRRRALTTTGRRWLPAPSFLTHNTVEEVDAALRMTGIPGIVRHADGRAVSRQLVQQRMTRRRS